MRSLAAPFAFAAALTLGTSAAAAHPPGVDDEGTPDPASRRVDLEERPLAPPPAGYGVAEPELPTTMPYYPWAPVPAGYHLRMGKARKALIYAGAITFGIGHVISTGAAIGIGTACDTCGPHAAELVIPVVGPFIAFGAHGKDDPNGMYPFLGLTQVLGFGMLLVGSTMIDQRLVRDDKRSRFSLVPALGPGQAGLTLRADL